MKFKGFNGAEVKVIRRSDEVHDHLEISANGKALCYMHILKDAIHVFHPPPSQGERVDIFEVVDYTKK